MDIALVISFIHSYCKFSLEMNAVYIIVMEAFMPSIIALCACIITNSQYKCHQCVHMLHVGLPICMHVHSVDE